MKIKIYREGKVYMTLPEDKKKWTVRERLNYHQAAMNDVIYKQTDDYYFNLFANFSK